MSFLDKVEDFFENLIPHETEPFCEATVKKGDTLWGIAEKITGDGSRWKEIVAVNPDLNEHDYLQIGEVLKLPKDWVTD